MDKQTARFFYEQCVGTTPGHMAHIPNNPVLYSLLMAYTETGNGYVSKSIFSAFLHKVADLLEDEEE